MAASVRIMRSNRHLLSVVNDTLRFSRVEAGALTRELQTLCASEVLARIEPGRKSRVRTGGDECARGPQRRHPH